MIPALSMIERDAAGKIIRQFGREKISERKSLPQDSQSETTELSKTRFAICKTCNKSGEQGHVCALHKSCCFGQWRSKPESKCYEGKW